MKKASRRDPGIVPCMRRWARSRCAARRSLPSPYCRNERVRTTGVPAAEVPAQLREVGFDQNLDQHAAARRRSSRTNTAGRCRSAITSANGPSCSRSSTTAARCSACRASAALRRRSSVLSEDPGNDFEVVNVSIDPRETPALALEKKAHYVERSGKPSIAKGWHYLTGTEANIQRLTKAAGFRYAWDASTQQFAHPAGIVIATPNGKVRVTCSASTTARAICGSLCSTHLKARSARRSRRRCSTAITTTLPPGDTASRSCASCSSPAPPRCCRSAR